MTDQSSREVEAVFSPDEMVSLMDALARRADRHDISYSETSHLCRQAALVIRALAAAQARAPGEETDTEDRMVRINKLIADLQTIMDRFGDTCVYIRRGGLSWGAVALNRRDDDRRNGVFDLQATHDRVMEERLLQIGRLMEDRDQWRDRAFTAEARSPVPPEGWQPIATVPRDGKEAFLIRHPNGHVEHAYLTTPEPPLVQSWRHYGGRTQGQQCDWPVEWMRVPAGGKSENAAAQARAPGDGEVEQVADAIDAARFASPKYPRERPRPFAEADKVDREYCLRLARAAIVARSPVPPEGWKLQAAIKICREVGALPDRTSPDDNADMMLVTPDELLAIVTNVLAASPSPPAAEKEDGWRTIDTKPSFTLCEERGEYRTDDGELWYFKPTHWRPLPAPPQHGDGT